MKTIAIMAIIMIGAYVTNAQEYVVDTKQSTLKWHGKKVTGEHYGHIHVKEGKMDLENDRIKSGTFIIDMSSITNTDLKDEATNLKLVNHLKSEDFFGVEKHPEAVLVITDSKPFENDEAIVEGILTIKSISHPVSFTTKRNGRAYAAEIVVDRSKYDVRFGSGSFFDNLGDKMIYDDFTMTVEVLVKDSSEAGL